MIIKTSFNSFGQFFFGIELGMFWIKTNSVVIIQAREMAICANLSGQLWIAETEKKTMKTVESEYRMSGEFVLSFSNSDFSMRTTIYIPGCGQWNENSSFILIYLSIKKTQLASIELDSDYASRP